MRRLERLGWQLGGLLPLLTWTLLIGWTAVWFALPPPLAPPVGGRDFAWLSALLVLPWLVRHARSAAPSPPHAAERDAGRELAFELRHGRGPAFVRHASRHRTSAGHAGRSHAGERPRHH